MPAHIIRTSVHVHYHQVPREPTWTRNEQNASEDAWLNIKSGCTDLESNVSNNSGRVSSQTLHYPRLHRRSTMVTSQFIHHLQHMLNSA